MTKKIIIRCDGCACDSELEGGLRDAVHVNWACDEENEFHYCPTCVKAMKDAGIFRL